MTKITLMLGFSGGQQYLGQGEVVYDNVTEWNMGGSFLKVETKHLNGTKRVYIPTARIMHLAVEEIDEG